MLIQFNCNHEDCISEVMATRDQVIGLNNEEIRQEELKMHGSLRTLRKCSNN